MVTHFIYWWNENRRTLRPIVRFAAILLVGVGLGYGVTEGFMPDERYVVEVRR